MSDESLNDMRSISIDIDEMPPDKEDAEPLPAMGKKMQIITVGPLLIGITLSILICVLLLFTRYLE